MGFHRLSFFGSSRSTETYLGGEELRFESHIIINHGSTKWLKYAYKEVEIARLHQQICVYI